MNAALGDRSREHSAGRRLGFTLLEILISAAILCVVLGSLTLALDTAGSTYRRGSLDMALEAEGTRALRRIVEGLRTASAASVSAVPAPPFSSGRIDYQASLGSAGAGVAWSDPRSIVLDTVAGRVDWIENEGLPSELRTGWCRGVPRYLEGELPNGADDNGNGLVDEAGLCLSRQGDLLTVRLTLERGTGSAVQRRTWTTKLLIRN